VRAFDGARFSPAVVTRTVIIVNTGPSLFEVELPTHVSTLDNVVAQVISPSIDADGDPVVYRYEWFIKQEDDLVFSPFSLVLDTALSSRVFASLTTTGDVFYCRVTPNDGEVDGPTVETNECEVVCAPPVPAGVQATDGAFVNKVVVTWDVSGATDTYWVYRCESNNPARAILLGTTSDTVFEDETARVPQKVTRVASGCPAELVTETKFFPYYYWVRASNNCGTSGFSAPDQGFVGEDRTLEDGRIAEKVIPPEMSPFDVERREARPDSILGIRLRHAAGIEPLSVWGTVVTASGFVSYDVDIVEVSSGDMRDIWVVHQPATPWLPYDIISFTVSGSTPAGEKLEHVTYEWRVASDHDTGLLKAEAYPVWQPDYADFDASALDLTAESNADAVLSELVGGAYYDVPDAVSPVYRIDTAGPAETPQRVWLPLPAGVAPGAVTLYYFYHDTSEAAGWYPAQNVEGWLVPDSFLQLEVDGVAYLGLLVRHPGVAQVGLTAAAPHAPAAVVTAPGVAAGNALVLALTAGAALLGGMRTARRGRVRAARAHRSVED